MVEALIVLIMMGILGGAFISLMMAQDRFYGRLDEGIAAEQSVRIAADLVSTEVRMGAPNDLLAAQPDSVSLRFDVYRAVVCDVSGGNSAYLFVYDSASKASLPGSFVGTAYSTPYSATYDYRDNWVGTGGTSVAAKTVCRANGTPDTTPNSLYRDIAGWNGNFPGGVPPRGSIVRRYRQLTYRLAPSGFGPGNGLFRGNQELAGPLDPTSTFQYVMLGGGVQNSVLPSNLPNVRMIRLNAIAVDDDPRFDIQRLLNFDIPLRN